MARLAERLRWSVKNGDLPASEDSGFTPQNYRVPEISEKRTGMQDKDLVEEMALARVSSMHLRGIPMHEIARLTGYNKAQIESRLLTLKQRWQAVALQNIDDAVAKEMARVDELESEYWDAWEASKNVEIRSKGGMTFQTAGDSAFLDGVMKCIERRCKLLGLDSPIKIDITAQVREMAIKAGLDPDDAVREAQLVLKEAGSGVLAIS